MEGHLLTFSLHLFPSWLFDPAKRGSVKFTARAPENLSSSESTGNKPPRHTGFCDSEKMVSSSGPQFPLLQNGNNTRGWQHIFSQSL